VEHKPSDKQAVGDVLESYRFAVTRELNEQYLYAVEDYHPRYFCGTTSSPPQVHPALLLNMSNITRSPSFSLSPGFSAIHTDEQCQFMHPAHVGSRFTVSWVVREAYEKRGRPYRVYEAHIVDENGYTVMKRTITATFASPEMKIGEKGS
jgi:hypothetical protein